MVTFEFAQALFRAGRADEARMEATTLVRLRPDWSQGYQRLGEALLALQEFEEAEAVTLCLKVIGCSYAE